MDEILNNPHAVKALEYIGKTEVTEDIKRRIDKVIPETITCTELLNKNFPEPKWIIPGIIPEGLTILAGAPKTGKSWLVLNLAIALSCNDKVFDEIEVSQINTLYLALEDTERRIKGRLVSLQSSPSQFLHFATNWEQGEEGIKSLYLWKERHPDTGCIIIDTLQRFRGASENNQTYAADYKIYRRLNKFQIP